MKATVELDKVLDLVWKHQEELAEHIDQQMRGTSVYDLLWEEYRRVSGLYDDIRRAAE